MNVLNEVLRYTKTNISPLEMISIADKAIKIKDTDLDQVEFPFEEVFFAEEEVFVFLFLDPGGRPGPLFFSAIVLSFLNVVNYARNNP